MGRQYLVSLSLLLLLRSIIIVLLVVKSGTALGIEWAVEIVILTFGILLIGNAMVTYWIWTFGEPSYEQVQEKWKHIAKCVCVEKDKRPKNLYKLTEPGYDGWDINL